MRVKFWGTRGSVPTPGRRTEKYGGNTACVEVLHGRHRLILDGGTGIRELGLAMAEEGPSEAAMLFSHFHWDHIQGLPFFVPFFHSGYTFRLLAPPALKSRVRKILFKQMESDVFPVDFGTLSAEIRFEELKLDGTSEGPFRISAFPVPHPGEAWAYRIQAENKTLVYATDCELNPGSDWETFARIGREVSGADLVILDGQYTAEEYPQREGWGHSAVEHVIELAREIGLDRVAITHHDPMRDDQRLTELERQVRKTIEEIEIFFARDGLAVDL